MIGDRKDQGLGDIWSCIFGMAAVGAPVALAWSWFILHR
jgi:hypothetical protein